jgi:curved DNA-binding protein CbpA
MNNYYDILNVTPEAVRTEIIETYQRLRKVFSEEQPAIYGLCSAEMLAEKIQELDLAYQVLSDTTKRESYDKELKERCIKPITSLNGVIAFGTIRKIEEEQPKEVKIPAEQTPEKIPAAKKVEPTNKPAATQSFEEKINGAVLARLRKEKKMSLEDLFEDTKIKIKTLEDIENDIYERLPARPYLRGFLAAYASSLKLEVSKVVNDYLGFFDEWKNTRKPPQQPQ